MEKYKDKLARIQKFRPIDDTFFEVLAQDPRVCEEILRTILEDPELEVMEVQTQKNIKNLYGRSVRLDALCRTRKDGLVNIEVQRSDNDDHLKRVRYHAACITASATDPGEMFERIPTIYAVYISEFDPFDLGLTAYHIINTIQETGTRVDDGFHRIFVNAKTDDGTDIARLMKGFLQEDMNDPKFPRISERIHMLKCSEGGTADMCEIMEEYAKEYAKESTKKIAKQFFQNGVGLEIVKASIPDLSEEELLEIYSSVQA